jgi:hypothetical protein
MLNTPRNEHNILLLYGVKMLFTGPGQTPAEPTCNLALSQTPPELLRFPQRPSLDLGAKTAEELIILKVRHVQ